MTNNNFAVARRHINSPSREIAIAACEILSESTDPADIRAVRAARVKLLYDLPRFANLREGDMVEDGRGFPVVLIIAGAIFTLMALGAWAIWADPVGRAWHGRPVICWRFCASPETQKPPAVIPGADD